MISRPYSIWIEAEAWAEGWDIDNIIVTFDDGSKWTASLFTYLNIQTLAEKNKHAGECLSGGYFWSSDMILIDECSRIRIEEVIENLILEGAFERLFSRSLED